MGYYRGNRYNYAGRGRRVYATSLNGSELPAQNEEEAIVNGANVKIPAQNEEEAIGNGADVKAKLRDADGGGVEETGGEIRSRFDVRAANCGQEVVDSQFQEGMAGRDLRSAAALLLEKASDFLFESLCDSCSAGIRERLTSIATGASAPNLSDIDLSHSCNGEGKVLCEDIVSGSDKRPGRITSQHHDRRAMIDAAADSNIITSSIAVSSLLSSHDAPAYRTRSFSQQAALPKLPDKVFSEPAKSNLELHRSLDVIRKKDFCFFDQVRGVTVNILEGLELHTNVLNQEEQQDLIDYIYELQELGRRQKLRNRTYSEPRKWMRGKGRVTIQFGCCYNYAVDKDGNPPGIIREEEVDEIPPKFRTIIKRLVEWQVLPPSCIPDSCIVNIYDVGDCIPPHIDHHDFVRPFCTLSLLSECNIIFGMNLKIAGPGDFKGSFSLPLPTGSVLILNGNGADVARHAVPAVPTKRISITFRKMDPLKVPTSFKPDKELLSTRALPVIADDPKPDKELLSTRPLPVIADDPKPTSPNFSSNAVDSGPTERLDFKAAQFSLESDFPALPKPLAPGRRDPHARPRNARS